jgi:hypothetical protein
MEAAAVILRCRAPSPTGDGTCGAFVYRAPSGMSVRFIRLLGHNEQADEAHHVARCRACGAFHEYAVKVAEQLDSA